MNSFETDIVNIDESALDALFDETPDKTVNANTLIGGEAQQDGIEDVEDDDEEKDETPKKKTKAPKQEAQIDPSLIEDVDLEDEEEVEDEEDEEDEDEDEDKKPKKESKKKDEKAPASDDEKAEVVPILKSTVDYLIEQGLWQDFEGREEMEFTEETYAALAAEQDKVRVESMFSELVDSTGPFGKAIIDFVKNGGNPDEVIDLFKEQKSVEAISIETPEGQKALVAQYYTDVMGWKPEKAQKYIGNLVLSNELENEAAEVKEHYSTYYKKEADRLNKEREEFAKSQLEAEKAFETNIKNTLKQRKDLSPAERQKIEDSLLNYDQKLPNGKSVNKFYVSFAKMQANPEDYIDLVNFVMDKQKFVQKVAKKEESKANAKAFSFIKGNGAVSTKKGTSYNSIKKNEKVSGFNWGLPSK